MKGGWKTFGGRVRSNVMLEVGGGSGGAIVGGD